MVKGNKWGDSEDDDGGGDDDDEDGDEWWIMYNDAEWWFISPQNQRLEPAKEIRKDNQRFTFEGQISDLYDACCLFSGSVADLWRRQFFSRESLT